MTGSWYHYLFTGAHPHGPFDTMQAAIDDARREWSGDFVVSQLSVHEVRIASWFSGEGVLEEASRNTGMFAVARGIYATTPDQRTDLERRLKAVCDQWQTDHGLTFTNVKGRGEPTLVRRGANNATGSHDDAL